MGKKGKSSKMKTTNQNIEQNKNTKSQENSDDRVKRKSKSQKSHGKEEGKPATSLSSTTCIYICSVLVAILAILLFCIFQYLPTSSTHIMPQFRVILNEQIVEVENDVLHNVREVQENIKTINKDEESKIDKDGVQESNINIEKYNKEENIETKSNIAETEDSASVEKQFEKVIVDILTQMDDSEEENYLSREDGDESSYLSDMTDEELQLSSSDASSKKENIEIDIEYTEVASSEINNPLTQPLTLEIIEYEEIAVVKPDIQSKGENMESSEQYTKPNTPEDVAIVENLDNEGAQEEIIVSETKTEVVRDNSSDLTSDDKHTDRVLDIESRIYEETSVSESLQEERSHPIPIFSETPDSNSDEKSEVVEDKEFDNIPQTAELKTSSTDERSIISSNIHLEDTKNENDVEFDTSENKNEHTSSEDDLIVKDTFHKQSENKADVPRVSKEDDGSNGNTTPDEHTQDIMEESTLSEADQIFDVSEISQEDHQTFEKVQPGESKQDSPQSENKFEAQNSDTDSGLQMETDVKKTQPVKENNQDKNDDVIENEISMTGIYSSQKANAEGKGNSNDKNTENEIGRQKKEEESRFNDNVENLQDSENSSDNIDNTEIDEKPKYEQEIDLKNPGKLVETKTYLDTAMDGTATKVKAYRVDENYVVKGSVEDVEGYIQVSPGVTKKIITRGRGSDILIGDVVTIHCVGYLDTNPPKKFWSTKDAAQKPFTFAVGKRQVIKGWDEGTRSMRLHELSRVKIEAKKAYGKYGFEAWGIPPDAGIILEIEIIEHKRKNKS